MKAQHLLSASILSADAACLGDEIRNAEKAGVDQFHFDITDGHFVENLTMGTLAVEAAKRTTHLPLDLHLMIENPERFIGMFAKAGATHIAVHNETTKHLYHTIQLMKDHYIHPGIAIGPTTPLSDLEWILEYIDYVLIVAVSPGFGGQSYLPNSMERIRKLKQMISATKRDILIQSDGGINLETINFFTEAGTDICTIGSALFKSSDYAKTVQSMRQKISF